MSPTRNWPAVACRGVSNPAALTLAAFLIHQPVPPSCYGDSVNRTHTQLRCRGLQGDRVHRLDSSRGRQFYTTACGLRVAKAAGVLTTADVDCQHFGCRRREGGG